MAESITVKNRDTVTGILKNQKSLSPHEVQTWLPKIRQMNPHISNLNRIFPGDVILIPSTLNEPVPPQKIWNHTFSQIPQSATLKNSQKHNIFFASGSETIEHLTNTAFSSTPQSSLNQSVKTAILLYNNPALQTLNSRTIPAGMIINITPQKLDRFAAQTWKTEQTALNINMKQLDTNTRSLFMNTGQEQTFQISRIVDTIKSWGAAIGTEDIVKAASYGIAGVSGAAASGSISLSGINSLAKDLYDEIIEKFGKSAAHSKKSSDLAKIQTYLKTSPKYRQLMTHLKDLPKALLPKGRLFPGSPS